MENKKNALKSITVITVVFAVLAITMMGTASAKSVYVIASWDTSPNPINAYDIQGNNLAYQTTNTVPYHGFGAMGLTIDTDSKTLFVSYEASNIIEKINAETFAVLGSQIAAGASNGAGIVVDQPKGLVYWIDRGSCNLYIYDVATFTLQNTVTLPTGSGGWGLAIDGNRLFVGDFSNTVRYYDTTSWAELGTITLSYPAVGLAVDSGNGFLYAGSYTGSNYLMKHDMTTGDQSSVSVGTDIQVRGVAVDQATGLVYITTGKGWSNTGKVEVYDSDLNFLSSNVIEDDPTGICVPSEDISYNPLQLSKTDGLTDDECVNAGANIDYEICYDNTLNDFDVHNVVITDTIPTGTTFVSATGPYSYDPVTNTVTWDIGTVSAGAAQQCVQLTVTVDLATLPGSVLDNACTINADEPGTGPTTVHEYTDVCIPRPIELCPDEYRWGDYEWKLPNTFVTRQEVLFKNIGTGDAYAVTATVTCTPVNVVASEPDVTLGDIPAGGSAWSSDTFELEIDMNNPQDPNKGFCWTVEYDDAAGVHHVIDDVAKFCGERCSNICP